MLFLERDPHRDAGERLAAGRHVGIRITVGAAEILLVHEPSVPHHHQTAVLCVSFANSNASSSFARSMPAFFKSSASLADVSDRQPPLLSGGGK